MGQHTPGPCGCRVQAVRWTEADFEVVYCPTHQAAPDLLKALQWAMVYLPKYPLPAYDQELRDIFAENLEFCNIIITKIEGRLG